MFWYIKKIFEKTLPLICFFWDGVSGSEINVLPSGYYKVELSLWCLCDLPASSNCLTLSWMTVIPNKDPSGWQPSQLCWRGIVSQRVGVKPTRIRKKREIILKEISSLLSSSLLLLYQDSPKLWRSIVLGWTSYLAKWQGQDVNVPHTDTSALYIKMSVLHINTLWL